MFSVNTTPEKSKNADITGLFLDLCLRKTRSGINVTPSFSKSYFLKNVFRPHETEKPAFSNSSCLKSVFERLRFRDGLVWTVGLTVEIKLRFQISPVSRSTVLFYVISFNSPSRAI